MENSDLEVVRTALEWLDAGRGVTLITIAKAWGSAPRPVGSLAAMRDDGRLAGSVSGGCVEEDLVEQLRAGSGQRTLPEVVSYGVTREDARRFGLPCGGRLELVVEHQPEPAPLRTVLDSLAARRRIARRLELDGGAVSLQPAGREQEFRYDGRILEKVFGPAWRLLLVGANQLSRYVAEMAQALDYEVIVCDPRAEITAVWQIPGVTLDRRMPDDAVLALANDEHSAVVTLTHDPRLDDMALMVALDSRAFYVGALGSLGSTAKRRQRLALLDVSEEGLGRLHGPVGLPIGSRTPPEIAIAILAELTAFRHGIRLEPISGSGPMSLGRCGAGAA